MHAPGQKEALLLRFEKHMTRKIRRYVSFKYRKKGWRCGAMSDILIVMKRREARKMDKRELLEKYRDINRLNPFISHNHITVEDIEPDRAVLRLEIGDDSRNIYGLVHGGAIYAMADNAAGCAVSTDGRTYVTQSSSMHFLRNQAEGVVIAEARLRHRGRSTCLAVVDITGEDGRLLATGEFTFFCVDAEIMKNKNT